MKKKLIALFAVLTALFAFGACGSYTSSNSSDSNSSSDTSSSPVETTASDEIKDTESGDDESEETSDTDTESDNSGVDTDTDNSSSDEDTDTDESTSDSSSSDEDEILADFTADEKALLEGYFGFVIPFAVSDDYSVTDETELYSAIYEAYVWYNAIIYTKTDFDKYKALFSEEYGYTFEGEEEGYSGEIVYIYSKNNAIMEVSLYSSYGFNMINVYVSLEKGASLGFTYTDVYVFNEHLGFVLPYAECDSYYLGGFYQYIEGLNKTQYGVEYLIYGFNHEDVEKYVALYTVEDGYQLVDTTTDATETKYSFVKDEYELIIKYYNGEEKPMFVYAYKLYDGDITGELDDKYGGNTNGGGSSDNVEYLYTDFTDEEKALYEKYFGFVIPFAPNNYYKVTDFSEAGEENYLYLTIILESEEELSAYVALFSEENGYVLDEDFENGESDGYTYYYFNKDGCLVMLCWTTYSGMYGIYIHVTN